MSINTGEGQPQSVTDRINYLREQEIQSGELRETSFGTFHFRYMSDPRYKNADPAVRDAIEQLDIPEITVTETEKVIKELKIKRKPVVTTVIPTNKEMVYVIPSLGIGGRAFSPTEVHYFFDPTHPQVVESLRKWKRRQIAHESNHLARWQANKRGETLLDALINEGLATHYEEHLNGVYQETLWGHALTEEKLMIEWEKAKTELHSKRYNHKEWFFGQNGRHSVWTGYSLGTKIVDTYMSRYPRIPMSHLMRIPSIEILKKSGFP